MPPKYKKKSAFYYFMEKIKNDRRYKSLAQAQVEADGLWKQMSAESRLPYQKMAKADIKPALSLENDLKQLEIEKKEAALQRQADIKQLISKLVQSNTLNNEYFHILHFNNFCYCNSTKKNYPAEVAIVKFSLNEGILPQEGLYSELIKPGRIPVGYSYMVMQKSEETHQIPAPSIDSTCNMKSIIMKLRDFLEGEQNPITKEYPPIFVRDKDEQEVNDILNQLCEDFSVDRKLFRIFSLQFFFYTLRNAYRVVWPSISLSIVEIEKDSYDCMPSLACTFHRDTSAFAYCSRCIVTRMVYIICDNCCLPWNITMIPGRHIPHNSLLKFNPTEVHSDLEYVQKRIKQATFSESESSDSDFQEPTYNTKTRQRDFGCQSSKNGTEKPPSSSNASSVIVPLRRPTAPSLSVSGMDNYLGCGRGRGIIKK